MPRAKPKSAEVIPFPGTVQDLMDGVVASKPVSVIAMTLGGDGQWTMHWSSLSLEEVVFAHRIMGILLDREAQGL